MQLQKTYRMELMAAVERATILYCVLRACVGVCGNAFEADRTQHLIIIITITILAFLGL